MSRSKLILMVILSFAAAGLRAEVMVDDDLGNTVRLERPADRIVSLAPHLTEIVFAAGAGDKLIGVVSYSDYPPAALDVPIIGSYNSINYEALVALQPDLGAGFGTRAMDEEFSRASCEALGPDGIC